MAKLIWAVTCSRILLDQPTNLVSYIDLLDGVALLHFPTNAPPTFIGTAWQREDEHILEMRVRAYAPDGSHLMDSQAVPLVFEPQHKRGRIHVGFEGFTIPGPGRYEFGIEIKKDSKWVEVTRIPFDVDAAVAQTFKK